MSSADVKRILALCRTKLDARTRKPWPDIQRASSHLGGIARDLNELKKTLEKFHIALNSQDLITLMNQFPTAKHVNEQGLAAFDFRAFANALYPPESLDLGPMGAQHAVLPFMGRHNPFIQPVAGAQPSVVPAGKFAPPTSGVAAVQPGFEHTATATAAAAANGHVEAAPVAAHSGASAGAPDSPQPQPHPQPQPQTPQYAQYSDEKHFEEYSPPAAASSAHQPHYASQTVVSGVKAKTGGGSGSGSGSTARSAITKGGAHVNIASTKRQLNTSIQQNTRRKSTGGSGGGGGGLIANPKATTSWMSSLKVAGGGSPVTTGRHFLHTTNFNAQFGEGLGGGTRRSGKGAAAGAGTGSGSGSGSGGAGFDQSANAARLYAIATGRSTSALGSTRGLDSTGRVPPPSDLTVTYNRRHHERRHEFVVKRPLTASQKRHVAYPLEESLGHGVYQHTVQPRFDMKRPGVFPDPNFHKTIAAGVRWPSSWSSK